MNSPKIHRCILRHTRNLWRRIEGANERQVCGEVLAFFSDKTLGHPCTIEAWKLKFASGALAMEKARERAVRPDPELEP